MAARRRAILWGATGQARVLREILKHQSLDVVAVFDNDESVTSPFPDVPIRHGRGGFERWLDEVNRDAPISFAVAIGGEHGRDRVDIHRWIESHGLSPIRAQHPSAVVLTDAVGAGAQILAQSTVCVAASLGTAVIVNTAASVDHDCVLEEGVHIAPGARLAGCVNVSRFVMVGAGAVIVPRVRVGEGAVIGAGAVVLEDVPDYAVVVGNPARIVGSRPRPVEQS